MSHTRASSCGPESYGLSVTSIRADFVSLKQLMLFSVEYCAPDNNTGCESGGPCVSVCGQPGFTRAVVMCAITSIYSILQHALYSFRLS